LRGARYVVRKPFTQRALENAVSAALPGRVPRRERPLAFDPAMRALCAQLEASASTSLSIVLSGETGTGKTHLARWLHTRSGRALGPLVELACGTLASAGSAGSGLDGAAWAEPGPLERAHGGTLLLEDVTELPTAEQLALLRLLVDRTTAHGAPLDVRVIATTRKGLARDAAEGRLHPDLAARLAAAELTIPPLRSRPLDLAPFAREFAERAARAAGAPPALLDEAAIATLRGMDLLGNLHELENLMRRATLLAPGRRVDLAELTALGEERARSGSRFVRVPLETLDLRELEREAIERALAASGGDRTLAARALGIHVRTLRNKLRARAR
jgi:DNA-binding NtrC family response regulator